MRPTSARESTGEKGNTVEEIGPFLTRKQVWEHIVNVIRVPITWRYFNLLCMNGKGPAAARRYGKRYLYTPDAPSKWADSYLRPGDKAAA
jgi:hypothetical protein